MEWFELWVRLAIPARLIELGLNVVSQWSQATPQFDPGVQMPGFQVSVPHRHDTTIAAERLRVFADKVRGELQIQVTNVVETWDDAGNLQFAFRAMGFQVSGKLENRFSEVFVAGTIPFAALPFRGMIESELAAKIREALEEPPATVDRD
jgi:hypothetical protein